jgi:hypothetical protein
LRYARELFAKPVEVLVNVITGTCGLQALDYHLTNRDISSYDS